MRLANSESASSNSSTTWPSSAASKIVDEVALGLADPLRHHLREIDLVEIEAELARDHAGDQRLAGAGLALEQRGQAARGRHRAAHAPGLVDLAAVAHARDELAQAVEDVGREHDARPRREALDAARVLAEAGVAGLADVGLDRRQRRRRRRAGASRAAATARRIDARADPVARGERVDVGDRERRPRRARARHTARRSVSASTGSSIDDVAGAERHGLVGRRDQRRPARDGARSVSAATSRPARSSNVTSARCDDARHEAGRAGRGAARGGARRRTRRPRAAARVASITATSRPACGSERARAACGARCRRGRGPTIRDVRSPADARARRSRPRARRAGRRGSRASRSAVADRRRGAEIGRDGAQSIERSTGSTVSSANGRARFARDLDDAEADERRRADRARRRSRGDRGAPSSTCCTSSSSTIGARRRRSRGCRRAARSRPTAPRRRSRARCRRASGSSPSSPISAPTGVSSARQRADRRRSPARARRAASRAATR